MIFLKQPTQDPAGSRQAAHSCCCSACASALLCGDLESAHALVRLTILWAEDVIRHANRTSGQDPGQQAPRLQSERPAIASRHVSPACPCHCYRSRRFSLSLTAAEHARNERYVAVREYSRQGTFRRRAHPPGQQGAELADRHLPGLRPAADRAPLCRSARRIQRIRPPFQFHQETCTAFRPEKHGTTPLSVANRKPSPIVLLPCYAARQWIVESFRLVEDNR